MIRAQTIAACSRSWPGYSARCVPKPCVLEARARQYGCQGARIVVRRCLDFWAWVFEVVRPLATIPPAEHSTARGVWVPAERGQVGMGCYRHWVILYFCPAAGLSGEATFNLPTAGLFGMESGCPHSRGHILVLYRPPFGGHPFILSASEMRFPKALPKRPTIGRNPTG
jgi:hypothetical protein